MAQRLRWAPEHWGEVANVLLSARKAFVSSSQGQAAVGSQAKQQQPDEYAAALGRLISTAARTAGYGGHAPASGRAEPASQAGGWDETCIANFTEAAAGCAGTAEDPLWHACRMSLADGAEVPQLLQAMSLPKGVSGEAVLADVRASHKL